MVLCLFDLYIMARQKIYSAVDMSSEDSEVQADMKNVGRKVAIIT